MQSIARQLLQVNRVALRSHRAIALATVSQRLLALPSSRLFSTTLTLRDGRGETRSYGQSGDRRVGRDGGDRAPRRDGPRGGGDMGARRAYEPRTDTPPSSCLYLGNLHYDVEKPDIQELLANFGEVTDVRFVMRDGRKMGSAFVDFADQASAEKAWAEIREHTPEIYGRAIRVDYAASRAPREARAPRPANPEGPKLFIGNAVGVDLQELFKGHNPVDIWQPIDKPFAFATFESIEKATEVLQQFNGQPAGSKMQELAISYAKPRETSDRFSGGGQSFRGGDRGGRGDRGDRPPRPQRSFGDRSSRDSYSRDSY